MTVSTIRSGMAAAYNAGRYQALNPTVNTGPDNRTPGNVKSDTANRETDSDSYNVKLSPTSMKTASQEIEKGDKDTAAIDRAIKKLREQIEEIARQLEKLKNEKGDAAESRRNMLTSMLADLNAQLVSLMAKKLDIK